MEEIKRDMDEALKLVKKGATILLIDLPQYSVLGMDTQVYRVGPAFKGIKMIPTSSPHFLYYSAASSRDGNQFSPMIGFFLHPTPSQVIVRKWDPKEERLVKLSEEEEERYGQAVKCLEFDRFLGPYDLNQYGEWKYLSSYLTKNVIERIEPIGGEITITSESDTVKSFTKTATERALDDQMRNSKFATSTTIKDSSQRGCYYTSIPHVIKRSGMTAEELTSLNLDKTELLESILQKDYGGSEDLLLGELQFSYIAFLMGQSLEAFSQWKSLVSLLLSCTDAPFRTRSKLFIKFIKVIYHQLRYGLQKDKNETDSTATGVSSLLDESWFSADSFLYRLCKDFFSLVEDASVVDGDLLAWTRKFKELLESSLGWEFQRKSAIDGMHFEEDDEYAPVVEMLDDTSYRASST